jgi:CDP-diglyceride synthetase
LSGPYTTRNDSCPPDHCRGSDPGGRTDAAAVQKRFPGPPSGGQAGAGPGLHPPFPFIFNTHPVGGERGPGWIFCFFCIVAAGDTGAFYSGTYLGRHKLCPWVSPKKTIEGSIGGLAANIIVALVFKTIPAAFTVGSALYCFCLAIGIAGQVGDLFASEFKRSAGIKDSGTLLPGHGGFLDRLDALLFASPLAYLLKISIF